MKKVSMILLALVLMTGLTLAAGETKKDAAPADEGFDLKGFSDAANWIGKEAEVSKSDKICPVGKDAIMMHIDITAKSGYPRIKYEPSGDEADWSKYSKLEFYMFADNLNGIDAKIGEYETRVKPAKKGEWQKVEVLIERIKDGGTDVTAIDKVIMGIDPKKYKAGSKVDFHLGGFRLIK